jgi:thioredoxin 1
MEQKYASPLTVTEANFDRDVLQSETPVLVDFSATWCGPCRAIAPVIDALAVDYGGRLTVATVDVDDNPGLANRYRIRSVPTVMLMSGGEIRRVLVGARAPREYRESIEDLLH